MTGCGMGTTGNCTRNWNFTIRSNGICTTQNPSCRIRHPNFSGILRHKQITESRLDDQTLWLSTRKKKKKEKKKKGKKEKRKKRKKKRTCWIVDFAVLTDHRVKVKGSEKRNKYLDLARELKKNLEHESDSDTNCNWYARYSHQMTGKGTEDHPNYNIKIGQNTERSPGDLRRLAVTQTPAEDHQLTLVWKILKEAKL